MSDTVLEIDKWLSTLDNLQTASASGPLIGFLNHLESQTAFAPLIEQLRKDEFAKNILTGSSHKQAPEVRTLEEVASACVHILSDIRANKNFLCVFEYGIQAPHDSIKDVVAAELVRRYIRPLLAFLELRSSPHTILEEYRLRLSTLMEPQFYESSFRIAGLFQWLMANADTQVIAAALLTRPSALAAIAVTDNDAPPQPESPVDVAAIGFILMKECAEGAHLCQLALKYHVWPPNGSTKYQDHSDVLMEQYVIPALKQIENELTVLYPPRPADVQQNPNDLSIPLEIRESLTVFKADHPEPTAFIMMQFAHTETHSKIVATIREAFADKGITALRADDHQYHDDVFPNVKTYMHGCDFGVAVFERIEDEVFNPNVSLEVGYLLAIGKPICYLKDKSLKRLPTDLISKLYREFDTHAVESTLPAPLIKWLEEKRIGKSSVGAV